MWSFFFMFAYIALFSALLSRLTALACGSTWVTSFVAHFLLLNIKWCTYSSGMAGATWNCSRLGANLCTPYNHAPCHFKQSHIRKVYACLAATGHLHFWQNDRDLLRATAVERIWAFPSAYIPSWTELNWTESLSSSITANNVSSFCGPPFMVPAVT